MRKEMLISFRPEIPQFPSKIILHCVLFILVSKIFNAIQNTEKSAIQG